MMAPTRSAAALVAFVVVAALTVTAPACSDETLDTLLVSVTSDAPLAGGALDALQLVTTADGVEQAIAAGRGHASAAAPPGSSRSSGRLPCP